MMRRLIFGCGLLLCGVIASCSDATGTAGTFLIVVSPDTVHLGQNPAPPFITYTERFVGAGQSKIWITIAELETEVTPGVWRSLAETDPNNLYLQAALGDAWAATTSDALDGVRSLYVRLVPGRYRVRQRFQLTAPNAMQPTGEISVATSNPFVVVMP